MSYIKQCGTCEFNFGGTCAGGDNAAHPYGAEIKDETDSCIGWGASLEYFSETANDAPWYIKEPYDNMRIDYDTYEEWLEADSQGKAIEVNIYDAIKHFYKISLVDLAVICNVSFNVIYRAKTHVTPEKRQISFSNKLCLPQKFFNQLSTHDFAELEKCAKTFGEKKDYAIFANAMPEWKLQIANEISSILRCPIDLAKEIARIDSLKWNSSTLPSCLSSYEKVLVDGLCSAHKKHGKELSHIEYSLDNASHVRINIF